MTKPKKKVLLDTNILLYADDIQSVFYAECNNLFDRTDLEFFVTDKVLYEYYRVMTCKNPKFAHILARDIINSIDIYQKVFEVLFADKNSLQNTFNLAQEMNASSGKIYDLNILAIAIENKIDILCTKNVKDFGTNSSIKILEPNQIKN